VFSNKTVYTECSVHSVHTVASCYMWLLNTRNEAILTEKLNF
jgi:hypothetical protein